MRAASHNKFLGIPWVYKLTLDRVIVKDALHLRVDGFSRVKVKSDYITLIMFSLERKSQFRAMIII